MLYKQYRKASTVGEAVSLLTQSEKAIPIAGGTDLMVQLHAGRQRGGVLVDISGIPELKQACLEGDEVVLGSALTYQDLIDSPVVQRHAPLLAEASRAVGAAQIQHMGTIGGNLATASPAGDILPPLFVLEAVLTLAGPAGQRRVPIREFFLGFRRTVLKAGELITEIRFRPQTAGVGYAFQKFGLRQSQAISVVSAACLLRVKSGEIQDARVALGAVAPTVIRSPKAEQTLIGRPGSPSLFEQAGQAAREDACPIDDLRGSAHFRNHVVQPLVHRALATAWDRANAAVPENR